MFKSMKKSINFFYKSPIFFSIITSFFISLVLSVALKNSMYTNDIITGTFLYMLIILPIILTIINILFFIIHPKNYRNSSANKKIEVFGLVLGTFFSIFIFNFSEITSSNWNVQLSNSEMHSPIYTKSIPTIMILFLISFISYCYCRYNDFKKQPPLVTVLGISSMYIGIILSIIWCIQLFKPNSLSIFLILLPINYIIILLKTIRYIVYQKSKLIEDDVDSNINEKFPKLNTLLENHLIGL